MFRYLSLLLLCATLFTQPCHALISGQTNNIKADSPLRRIDANSCNSPWAGVVSIEMKNGIYSGVIIGQSWVLTAAHVAEGSIHNPQQVTIHIPCQNQISKVERIFIHPKYHHYDAQGIQLYDVGLLRLQKPLASSTTRYPVNFQTIHQNTVATLIGYGASGSENSQKLQPSSFDIKRWGQNALDTLLTDQENNQLAYIYDFDGPDKTTNYLGGLTLGNQRETEVAPGDSGSPIFIRTAGKQWVVAGINTFRMSFPEAGNYKPPPPEFGSGGGGILLNCVASWMLHLIPDLQVNQSAVAQEY